jgi:F-type H+-transporting ATPase subunit b
MNEAHAEAQGVTAAAKADAAKDADKRIAAADKRLAAKAEEAAQALDEARRGALAEVEGMAAEAAREIVAKLTEAKVDEKAVRTAVAGALSRA